MVSGEATASRAQASSRDGKGVTAVESLAGFPAFQALHPDAQALERRIQLAWARRAELPADEPAPRALRARVDELVRDLAELAVPSEDWQTL